VKLCFSLSKPLPAQTAIRLTVKGQLLPWDGSDDTLTWETDETNAPLSATLELIPSKGFFRKLIDGIRNIQNPLLQGLAWLAVPLCGILAVPLSVLRLILMAYGIDTAKTPLWLADTCPYRGAWTFSLDLAETCTIAIGAPAYRSVIKRFSPPRCAVNGQQIEGQVSFDADRLNQIFKRSMATILLGIGTLSLCMVGLSVLMLVSFLRGELAAKPDDGLIGIAFGAFLFLLILVFLHLPLFYYFVENSRRKRILKHFEP